MASNTDEQKFLLSCLMHGTGKIDFEAVARENGYTNPRSAANRLSAIKKNASAGTTITSTDEKPITATSPVAKNGKITKRKPRKSMKTLSKKIEEAIKGSESEEEA